MNSDNGGLSSSERQRQAAAELARKKTLAAYSSYQPKAVTPAQTAMNAQAQAVQAQRQQQDPQAQWRRYHSAWQNYYQKYYSDYYSKAARQFVDGERAKLAAEKARLAEQELAAQAAARIKAQQAQQVQQPQPQLIQTIQPQPVAEAPALPETPEAEKQGIFARRLKARAAKKASRSEKQRNRRRRLAPIIAGLTVVFVILFLQYNRLIFAPIAAYVSPGEAPSTEISSLDPTITSSVSADPKLIIPKLNVEVPVAFGVPLDNINAAMNNGVAQFRIQGASAYPGEIGNLVISGHSAGDIYSANQYKFIFSGLERLKEGDLIYINYNSTRYTYRMTGSKVVEPSDIASLTGETDKPVLILVTCTPLGTSRFRLLIYADQISPTYADSQLASDDDATITTTEESLPQNEPTFFENIWNWLTGQN